MASALVAACLLAAGPGHAEFDRASMIQWGRGVLRVEAQAENGRLHISSGVVIAKEQVVTNCHVTRAANSISVSQAGTRWPVQAQAVDAEHDLCVLQVPGLPNEPVMLGRADTLREGQELAAMSYIGGLALRLSGGSVVALHRWKGHFVIQCSNGFTSGGSGGGLFDQNGRLVGILTFRLPGGRADYYAVPAEWLIDMRQQLRFAPVQPHDGQAFWQRPADQQPFFLQAAAMAHSGQWEALLQLTERWAGQDTRDAEPLHLRAMALKHLGRDDAAIQSWQHSLQVNPGHSLSWAGLAELYHRTGQCKQEQRAIDALTALNPGLALEMVERLRATVASEPQTYTGR